LEDLTVFPHCLPSQDFPQYDFFHVLKGALKSEGFTTLFTFIGFLPPPPFWVLSRLRKELEELTALLQMTDWKSVI
jgi:hypothetical protein